MAYDPKRHHRRSIRLKNYDYTAPGAYFVTVVTQGRACLFGEVADSEMQMNEFGDMARDEWTKSCDIRREIMLDAFVVMPNHIHGIVIIHEFNDPAVQAHSCALPQRPAGGSLGALVAGYKSAATRRINEKRSAPGLTVWQRNYYEHIVRDEAALNRIRQYILDNPARWSFDRENPKATGPEPEEAWRDRPNRSTT